MQPDQDFQGLLTPVQEDTLRFCGQSLDLGSPTIFGGQLMAQVLSAAGATLAQPCPAHYLQINFVTFGDPAKPLSFQVTVVRDGKSTSHRLVAVTQQEKTLLTACVSFQRPASGFEHQITMPDTQRPEVLLQDPSAELTFSAEQENRFPFLILNCAEQEARSGSHSAVWAKPRAPVIGDPLMHQMLFAFFTDATILQSALRPHQLNWSHPDIVVATMNHSIWFHRQHDVNAWVLLDSESPSTGNGRALSMANAFSEDGTLVASVSQEGVLRHRTRSSQPK